MSVLSRVEALRRHVLSPRRRLSAARPRPSGRSLLLTLAPLRTPTDKEADPDADIDDTHVSDGDGDDDDGDGDDGGVLTSPGGLPLLRYWTGSRLAAREVTAGRFLSPRPAAAASPGGNLVAQLPLASPHTVHQPSRAPVAMTACPPRVSSWTCWRRVHLADGRCCSCRRCGAWRGRLWRCARRVGVLFGGGATRRVWRRCARLCSARTRRRPRPRVVYCERHTQRRVD